MKRIKLKLYRILRSLGLDKNHISMFTIFDEELKLDKFDQACYLYYIENSFNISIPDQDIVQLKTIDNTINYLYDRTNNFGGLS